MCVAVYKETRKQDAIRRNAPPDWEHGDHEKNERQRKHLRNQERRVPALDQIRGHNHEHQIQHQIQIQIQPQPQNSVV